MKTVEVDGYTPRMRVGIHTGRPQRIGGDWLGVDVNIAARVMERAVRGGLIVSETTLTQIPPQELEALGLSVKRVRRQVFAPRQTGVPPNLVMYRVKSRRDVPGEDEAEDPDPHF
jgi:class 3 adenylate cyclase